MLAEIPSFFLSTSILSAPGDFVMDPFCGTGTVLLEAAKRGRTPIGADSNPLARLITRVKLSCISEERIHKALVRITRVTKSIPVAACPDVVNIDHWFHPHVKRQLIQLSKAIARTRDLQVREFLQVCFSCCVRDVSKADPRLSVPVALRHDQYPREHPLLEKTTKRISRLRRINVIKRFIEIAEANARLVSAPLSVPREEPPVVLRDAATLGSELEKESIQLVITSPPYLGAQKYIRASSLSLGWLGLARVDELKVLDGRSIGREHFRKETLSVLPPTGIAEADNRIRRTAGINPLRAKIASSYLSEMQLVIKQLVALMKPNGYLVLVLGNNHLCGVKFPTERYLRRMAEAEGLSTRLRLVDIIKSRGLMTKRNKTANLISREWILLMQKAGS